LCKPNRRRSSPATAMMMTMSQINSLPITSTAAASLVALQQEKQRRRQEGGELRSGVVAGREDDLCKAVNFLDAALDIVASKASSSTSSFSSAGNATTSKPAVRATQSL
jgi:hypothetical protein